jgi:phosphoglycerate dehydrogenase-like enzyme
MFRVVISPEFVASYEPLQLAPGFHLERLEQDPSIELLVDPTLTHVVEKRHVAGAGGLLLMDERVTRELVAAASDLLVVARYGVGTDGIDLDGCTDNGVLVTITPEGVSRPVASAAMTLLLALAHRLEAKQQLLRSGRWTERASLVGPGLADRTLGIIGLGRIGRELALLARAFGPDIIGFDPYVDAVDLAASGVSAVAKDELLERSDFVCICCPLTPETHHIVAARELSLMKPSAYLVNVSRGAIVDEPALVSALADGEIAGAGLDVFEQEPINSDNPLLGLENVIATPHSLCWTDECFTGNGTSAAEALASVARGRMPQHIANRAVDSHARLARLLRQQPQALTPNPNVTS